MTTKGNVRRAIAVTALAAFLPLATVGCFGKFELTKKVYRYNRDFNEDKWMQEVLFLVLSIIPIYGGAVVLDAVVFNSFEFWTGKNPVLAGSGSKRIVVDPEGRRVTMTRVDADRIEVSVVDLDGARQDFALVREDRAISAWSADGALLARVTDDRATRPIRP